MLFVYEDEAEVGGGGKDGASSADDDGGFAGIDASPLFAAFLWREGGVEQGYALAEGLVEETGGLGGEADFGDEEDGRQAAVEGALHGGEVDGGFAGAGDSMKQKGLETPEGCGDGGEGFKLGFVELDGGGGLDAAEAESGGSFVDADEAAADQGLEGGGG